jgi:hypothetical protein
MEDYEFWLRVLAEHPLRRLERYNSGLVQHSGRSLRQFRVDDTLRQKDYIFQKFSSDERLRKTYSPAFRRLDSSMHVYAAVQSNFNGDSGSARRLLRKAFRIDPTISATIRYWGAWRRALVSGPSHA